MKDGKIEIESGKPGSRRSGPSFQAKFLTIGIIALLSLGVLGAGLKYLDDDAQRELARRADRKANHKNQEQSFLNRINPFLPSPTPTPTPQLSKSYVYAGQRLLAVEDANANAAPPSDLAVWRPSSGEWWVMAGTGTQQVTQGWGVSGDVPVPGDYDGDGKTDFAVFRPDDPATTTVDECQPNCQWYVIYSGGGSIQFGFGANGDQPMPADYDGDGKADIALWRSSNATWYLLQSSDNQTATVQFGIGSDEPVQNDYDGDGKVDIAVWRTTGGDAGKWYIRNSTNPGNPRVESWGAAGDVPVPAFWKR